MISMISSIVVFVGGGLIGFLLGGFVGFFFADKKDESERIRFWKSLEEEESDE
jgi:gas vesicle protein